MSVRTISDGTHTVLYDSVTETAFGPVIRGDETAADDFLDWLEPHGDPRNIREDRLSGLYQAFLEHGADSDVRVYGAGGA